MWRRATRAHARVARASHRSAHDGTAGAGHTQYLAHRLRVRAIDQPYVSVTLNDAERDATANYHAQIAYDRPYPNPWQWEV